MICQLQDFSDVTFVAAVSFVGSHVFERFDVSDLFFEICVRRFRRADSIS